jgi:hypothetical protein
MEMKVQPVDPEAPPPPMAVTESKANHAVGVGRLWSRYRWEKIAAPVRCTSRNLATKVTELQNRQKNRSIKEDYDISCVGQYSTKLNLELL